MRLLFAITVFAALGCRGVPDPRPNAATVTPDDLAIMTAALEALAREPMGAANAPVADARFVVGDHTLRTCRDFEPHWLPCFHQRDGHETLNFRNRESLAFNSLPSARARVEPFSDTSAMAVDCATFAARFPEAAGIAHFSLPAGIERARAELLASLSCGRFGWQGWLLRVSRSGESWRADSAQLLWTD